MSKLIAEARTKAICVEYSLRCLVLEMARRLEGLTSIDTVPVVRCKDCVYFQPDFVLTNNGERRPYTEEEKQSNLGMVSCDVGINCGSRCERHDYWDDNNIPVWFRENDFCSYGKRKGDGE